MSDDDGPIDTACLAVPVAHARRSRAAAIVSQGQKLTHLTTSIKQDLQKSVPSMQLPSDVKKELKRVTLHNAVAALPLQQERRRPTTSLAGSVLHQRLNLWLESEAGADWKKQQDARVSEAYQ